MKLISYLLLSIASIGYCHVVQAEYPLDYDIVYVRYDYDEDVDPENPTYLKISQGEDAYQIEDGADLILLKYNPESEKGYDEIVLVNCDDESGDTCSVMDPTISFDAKTVYYSLITSESRASSSWLYKIKLEPPYTPIRLTFNDGFDSKLYAANNTAEHDQSYYREIRDMSPIPLSDGRLLFTSNRAGLTALNPGTNGIITNSVSQLYTMEDHDGELKNSKLAQITRLETGTLTLAQHPIQLKDGRILFSTWQNVANKFHYAMTPLFTIHPDGTNLQQFTEPHDHHKRVEHFVTQLPDEQVISGSYYPVGDWGFGMLLRHPLASEGPDFVRNETSQFSTKTLPGSDWFEYREFSRKGTDNFTLHANAADTPSFTIDDEAQGKYSMPAITKNSALLVAWSKGYVNHFDPACKDLNRCEDLKSGIYLTPDISSDRIANKNELIKVKDDLGESGEELYNEIWPKPVLTYQALYGVEKPAILPSTLKHNQIKTGQAVALVGTSSMYNRESSESITENDPNGAQFPKYSGRELHKGNWAIQGTDVGVYQNSDIYGVRIISTPAKPYTKPINRWHPSQAARWLGIKPYLVDSRLDDVVARYGSFHGERWEILGEFPLTNKEHSDLQGNPDTSWVAKVPADTPFLIQTIDKNGMTLNSELTWRGLKSGEIRTDCGGCHAHSIEPLEFSSTQASKNLANTDNITAEILNEISGIAFNDRRVRNGLWDLTTDSTPVLTGSIDEPSVSFQQGSMIGVEFTRDIQPLLETHCLSCHQQGESAESLLFDGSAGVNAYLTIKNSLSPEGGEYLSPQIGRYIRSAQARESLLTWIVWGKRLDGRQNDTYSDDIDYSEDIHNDHTSLNLSDDEKRMFSRWIDLGSPIDFPETDGMGYTDDNQLPIINIEINDDKTSFTVGLIDAHSGIDWSTVNVEFYALPDELPTEEPVPMNAGDVAEVATQQSCASLSPINSDRINSINTYQLSLTSDSKYMIEVSVADLWGNKNIATRKLIN